MERLMVISKNTSTNLLLRNRSLPKMVASASENGSE